jgi:hypothetical protein
LINQAESGDGVAFDTLVRLTGDTQISQTARDLALKVAKSIVASHNTGIYMMKTFTVPITEAQQERFLVDAAPENREAAVDSLGQSFWKSHLDQLFGMMTSDPALEVRASGFNQFKAVTQIQADALDNYTAQQWWSRHRGEFVK